MKYKLGQVLEKYIRGPFGSALRRPEMKQSGIPVYEQQNAIYNHRLFRFYIDELKYFELKRFTVQPNDLIVSCSGTIGKVSIIKEKDPVGIISQALLILRPNNNIVLSEYLFYFLTSKYGHNSLVSRSSGSVQINIAKREVIENIEIDIPDLETQKKIVRILSALDKKIEINSFISSILIKQCQLLYEKFFTNSLNKCFHKRLDELGLDISDGNYSNKYPTKKEFQSTGVPFIRGVDFDGYSISRKNLVYISANKHKVLKKGHLKRNDILITTRGEIGKIVFVPDYFIDSNINAQLARINGGDQFPMSFLWMSLLSTPVQEDIRSLVTGTALQQLPIGKLNQVKILIPRDTRNIQDFDRKAAALIKKIQVNEDQNYCLMEIRNTILPKLMSDEINLSGVDA